MALYHHPTYSNNRYLGCYGIKGHRSPQEKEKQCPTTRPLQNAKYSFDASRNAWYCGKKPVPEEEVLVHLIRYAKSEGITDAGEWAGPALSEAKATPELTTPGFVKACMVRNRNRRIAGKYLFQNWARAVGIEITGKLEDFLAKNSLLVNRFYNEIAAGYECCKKQGRVMRSVFSGWELRDEDADAVDRAQRRHHPKPVPPPPPVMKDGLQRYNEFMISCSALIRERSKSLFCASGKSVSYLCRSYF